MQVYDWSKEGFEAAYSKHYYKLRGCGAIHKKSCSCNDSVITYSRTFFLEDPIFKVRAEKIEALINYDTGTNILVLGCALGFLMEELQAQGLNVWGIDNSQYIHTIKNKTENRNRLPIHNVSVLDNNFVSEVKRVCGVNWFTAIITEDLLTSHNDFSTIISRCEQLLSNDAPKSNIVHLVDLNTSAPFTVKTAAQWKQVAPTHTWVDSFGDLL